MREELPPVVMFAQSTGFMFQANPETISEQHSSLHHTIGTNSVFSAVFSHLAGGRRAVGR